MRRFILLFAFLATFGVAYSETITQAEWFIGTDPGEGLGNPISVGTPNDSVSLGCTVTTGSLTPGLYLVLVRCRTDSGRWGVPSGRLLSITPGSGVAQLVTALEYWFDDNTPTFLDIEDDDLVSFNQLLSTVSLNPGLHRFFIRYRDDLGRWGNTYVVFLSVSDSIPNITQVVTQIEYWVDSNPSTIVDITDSALVDIDELVGTLSLDIGLHNVYMRCRDENGRWGEVDRRSLVVASPFSVSQPRYITHLEYWVDNDPATLVDIVDSAQVNINEFIGTLSLGIGLHEVFLRCRDDVGRWSGLEQRVLIVTSPVSVVEQKVLTAAEYFVNVDPGPGNGMPIPLPSDSIWDEGEETVHSVITGLPLGLYLVGMRVQDDAGRWSKAVLDSMIVGPILSISVSGNNIILDWLSGSGADAFHIYRANTLDSQFTEIDSTNAQTYMDVGIIATDQRGFYRVTFSPRTLSRYHQP